MNKPQNNGRRLQLIMLKLFPYKTSFNHSHKILAQDKLAKLSSKSVRVVQLPHGYPVGAGRGSVGRSGVANAIPAVLGLDGGVGGWRGDGSGDAETVIIKLHLLLLQEIERNNRYCST